MPLSDSNLERQVPHWNPSNSSQKHPNQRGGSHHQTQYRRPVHAEKLEETERNSRSPGHSNGRSPSSPAKPRPAVTSPQPESEPHLSKNGSGSMEQNGQPPAPPEPERGFMPVLKNRNFLVLWSGQVFSQLADKVYLVLMIGLVASRFQSEGQSISGWVSAIMVAFTIPAVLLGSLAGALTDRWSKKGILVATNIVRGMFVLCLPLLLFFSQGFQLGTVPLGFALMLMVTFVVSTLTQFFAPAEQAVLPLILERRLLLPANSLYTTTMMASVIVGFAVGEPLLAIADRTFAHIGNGVGIGKELVVGGSYCIAGLLLLMMKTGEKPNPPDTEYPHVFEDIRDGWHYLSNHQRIKSALIQLVILFSIFAALAVLAVRLAEIIPTLRTDQFGFLLAAAGAGMGAGAAFLGHFGQHISHRRLSLFGSVGMALCLASLSLFGTQLWAALGLITGLGIFASFVGVPMQTTIQAETPEEMRGKVFGLQNNAINIALTLPLALAGVAESMFGLKVVLLSLGAIAIAGGVYSWYISQQEPHPSSQGSK